MTRASPPGPSRAGAGLRTRIVAPFAEFAQTGAFGGVLLLVTGVLALAWANSPWAHEYHAFWERTVAIGWSERPMTLPLHAWINDALMVVFFLVVGLEIKRELLVGELAQRRQAALPIAAAVGGMVVPALLFTALNAGTASARGWGIPMATDIAFALGVLALLGTRVPIGLKVFLAALAIVDDLGAVLVIALFYTESLDLAALGGAAVALGVLVALNRARVMALAPYLLGGVALWYFVLQSGVHATVAGVLLALTIPASAPMSSYAFSARGRELLDAFDASETGDGLVITSRGQQDALYALDLAASRANAPLLRLEHALHPLVSYGLMPVFALANAGVTLGEGGAVLAGPVAWGVILGLVVGKPLGIALFSWGAIRLGLASMPAGVTWAHLRGAAMLGGIGFTMALFITGLAFGGAPAGVQARVGILLASTVAGIAGYLLLCRTPSRVPGSGEARDDRLTPS